MENWERRGVLADVFARLSVDLWRYCIAVPVAREEGRIVMLTGSSDPLGRQDLGILLEDDSLIWKEAPRMVVYGMIARAEPPSDDGLALFP
jgi:hypothetical protein